MSQLFTSYGLWQIKMLEEKLRQHEQQGECVPIPCSAEKLGATPMSLGRETTCDVDPLSQRSVNSSNRTMNQGSILLKGTDSLRELRRKRDIQSKGTENNFFLSNSLLEKKALSAESNKARHLDPSRALARIARSTNPVSSTRKAYSNTNRITKDQGPWAKESNSNNKYKIWLR